MGQALREKIVFVSQTLPFSVVFKHYGLNWKSDLTHQLSCPFHGEDKNPSARYYSDTRVIHCFACSDDPRGDVVWFIKKWEKLQTVEQTLEFIRRVFGVSMADNDVNAKIKLREALEKSLPRKVFSDTYKNKVNDIIYRLRQDPRVQKIDLSPIERVIWDNWRDLEGQVIVDYIRYCELIRLWFDDSILLIKKVLETRFREGVV